MDNTVFAQKQKYSKIFASKGSINMWSNYAEGNFHINFVTCPSTVGTVTLPILFVPGKCLNRNILEDCDIDDARVTTALGVFINSTSFFKLINLFAASVPDSIPLPLVFVYYGYYIH